jgi:hypothetical protein
MREASADGEPEWRMPSKSASGQPLVVIELGISIAFGTCTAGHKSERTASGFKLPTSGDKCPPTSVGAAGESFENRFHVDGLPCEILPLFPARGKGRAGDQIQTRRGFAIVLSLAECGLLEYNSRI